MGWFKKGVEWLGYTVELKWMLQYPEVISARHSESREVYISHLSYKLVEDFPMISAILLQK